MSRIAKQPVVLPKGVEVTVSGDLVRAKGPLGQLEMKVHPAVAIEVADGVARVQPKTDVVRSAMYAGTMRALLANMVKGVSEGFERRLQLVGVGYRAQAQGKQIQLSLGFSHPVIHALPDGVKAETPSQTEIVLKGIDKQLVGQEAAKIRAYRPPEPYKGKGVRYAGEQVILKETKKK
ncbi:50S ribosomal protein L6 [Hydrogenophilus thermoluteolus]|uniref:Large ribosomal subunit protein uL6 n=1 Tax=Hydrogenophilus thermoluteolus TaxID=297 RepID=A0A2Z6DW56_HYDTE|nr:50S ribosomal protein L6 [Hydrogenophilus thermoluteolus]BBD76673.1 50S ribosomal protein L6 [Hydrogenophilus thermoluteolus]GLW60957.1 50S ribosomal protein L6 [Hydrogenophilus thermoluteolus]